MTDERATSDATPGDADDPVLRRRRQMATMVSLAKRLGYLALVVALVVFFWAMLTEFDSVRATIIIVCLIVMCVVLAPAIVVGYAIKAADREDREQAAAQRR